MQQFVVDLPGVRPATGHPDHGLGLCPGIPRGAVERGPVETVGLPHVTGGVAQVAASEQPVELLVPLGTGPERVAPGGSGRPSAGPGPDRPR